MNSIIKTTLFLILIFKETYQFDYDQVKDNPLFPKTSFASTINTNICDISSNRGICTNKGAKVILSSAKPKDLIGYWTFDDSKGLDSSGNGLHINQNYKVGSSFGGKGSSAYFNGTDFLSIAGNKLFNQKIYSVSFWVFLIQENIDDEKNGKALRWCPILQKGFDNKKDSTFTRAPGIFIDRKERSIKVVISTSDYINQPTGESITSTAKIPFQRWTHLAIVRGERKTSLYVNGILDVTKVTNGLTASNKNPLFIGSVPWHQQECMIPLYIDELRFYKREISSTEIEGEAASALGGIEPRFVRLSCTKCSVTQASKGCEEGYHLCTSIELHTGGLQVARAMGWIGWNSDVWAQESLLKARKIGEIQDETDEKGEGICCSDLR